MTKSKGHWEHKMFSGLAPERSQISEALSAGGPLVFQAGSKVWRRSPGHIGCCACCLTCSTSKSGPERSPAAAHTINADIIIMAQKGAAAQREESSLTGERKTAGMHK